MVLRVSKDIPNATVPLKNRVPLSAQSIATDEANEQDEITIEKVG